TARSTRRPMRARSSTATARRTSRSSSKLPTWWETRTGASCTYCRVTRYMRSGEDRATVALRLSLKILQTLVADLRQELAGNDQPQPLNIMDVGEIQIVRLG